MFYRKPPWWWDWLWNPVGGCKPPTNSPGCANCWVLKWLNSHTWERETVYTGAISAKANKRGRRKFTGALTALRAGDEVWDLPLTHPGVVNPALDPEAADPVQIPNLIFAVVDGDLFQRPA